MRKTYIAVSIDHAISLLRPGALYSYNHQGPDGSFIEWNDPRPAPTYKEICDTMDKIRKFEDSIDCIE